MSFPDTSAWYDEHFYSTIDHSLSPWYRALVDYIERHRPAAPIVELGCGSGALLLTLAGRRLYGHNDLCGLDQSEKAVAALARRLPNVIAGDIERPLPYSSGFAGCVVLAEVIEHLVDPQRVLAEIRRVLKPGGLLVLSFQNYLNLPWLTVRVLSDMLDKPSWINLQPIDRMYTYPVVARKLRASSFDLCSVRGSVFLPPLLYRWETNWFRSACDALRLGPLSFHPIIVAKARA